MVMDIALRRCRTMEQFVEGWYMADVLGEGAYGEVKLLMNKENRELIAMKVINFEKFPQAKVPSQKEIMIHRKLKHQNIIKFLGFREYKCYYYLFIEYAPNGELFELIEPDVGMSLAAAQKYTRQLCDGVEYIHSMGIVHRDLKPENLLLDANHDLKICDFGLSTVFRSAEGRVRRLKDVCGTRPYCAPEVLTGLYVAEPTDIWSIGIIITVLLSGELPWDNPEPEDAGFLAWRDNNYSAVTPWNRISPCFIRFIKFILALEPSARPSLQKIKAHPWFTLRRPSPNADIKTDKECVVQSQPLQREYSWSDVLSKIGILTNVAFSQPTQPSDMMLSSQGYLSQSSPPLNRWQKLVKKLTRFSVSLTPDEASSELTDALGSLGLSYKILTPGLVTVETSYPRKNLLIFKISIISMEPKTTLLNFQLFRGCGLDFKRLFVSIKSILASHVLASPPLEA